MLLMNEGRSTNENQAGYAFLLIILLLIGAYFYFFHEDLRDLNRYDENKSAGEIAQQREESMQQAARDVETERFVSSDVVFPAEMPPIPKQTVYMGGLGITINGRTYSRNATLSPKTPVRAIFSHPDRRVQQIKMQKPGSPQMFVMYPLDTEVEIDIHTRYMQRGEMSSSEFLAIDEKDRVLDRIELIFKP